MPASFGFRIRRIALASALRPACRADHFLWFDHAEPAPIRRINGNGFLVPEHLPTPVGRQDVLELRDDLFDSRTRVIFDGLTSRRVSYGASTGPRIEVRFEQDVPERHGRLDEAGRRAVHLHRVRGRASPTRSASPCEIWDKPSASS